MTYVYFIVDRSVSPALVKIGTSTDPDTRASELQVGNGHKLEIIGCIPGDESTEGKLHDAFKPFHVRGEWYLLYPNGEELIKDVCEKAEHMAMVDALERSIARVRRNIKVTNTDYVRP